MNPDLLRALLQYYQAAQLTGSISGINPSMMPQQNQPLQQQQQYQPQQQQYPGGLLPPVRQNFQTAPRSTGSNTGPNSYMGNPFGLTGSF